MSPQQPEPPRDAGLGSLEARVDSALSTARNGPTSSANFGESLVGRLLRDTYKILGVLEHGGMGTVYRAEHQRLRRPVAIKVLAQHLTADQAAMTRFRREAEIVSQLHHPHIVHILDFDTTDDGDPYIVMELLSGEALSRRLHREKILALRDTVQIVNQTATGLIIAHAAGIVHRDLKPDNVFLLEMQDRSVFVKLLDFGISKRTTATARVTGEFDVLGTPDYMAPEQVLNTAKVDHRADQWSLAAMTYEMLCGKIPFFGETVTQTLGKVVGENPTPLTELAPGLPKAMASVVARGLAKNPADRFASVIEFADNLTRAAGISLNPKPASWNGITEPLGPHQKPTLDAIGIEQPPIVRAAGRASRSPLKFSIPTSESQLPIPTVPRSEATPSREAPTVSMSNPRLRRSDPPPSLEVPEPPAKAKRPARARLRDSSRQDESTSTIPPSSAAPLAPQSVRFETAPIEKSRKSPGQAIQNPEPVFESDAALVRLQSALDEVRQAVAFGEDQRAVAKARVLLQLAQAERTREANALIGGATDLLGPILLRNLGGRERKVSLQQPQSSRTASMSPQHLFLLSRIDGTTTVEELLDVSPLSTPETLGILLDFRDEGYLAID